MDWAVPADEGDAARAAVEIRQWRETLPPAPRDRDGVMAQVRDRLQLLWMSPVVRGDAECLAIFDGMRLCRDMAEFEAAVTRLQARIAALVRGRAASHPPPDPAPTTAAAEPARRAERAAAAAWRSILKA